MKPLDNKHPLAFGLKLREQTIFVSISGGERDVKMWLDVIATLKKAVEIAQIGKYY